MFAEIVVFFSVRCCFSSANTILNTRRIMHDFISVNLLVDFNAFYSSFSWKNSFFLIEIGLLFSCFLFFFLQFCMLFHVVFADLAGGNKLIDQKIFILCFFCWLSFWFVFFFNLKKNNLKTKVVGLNWISRKVRIANFKNTFFVRSFSCKIIRNKNRAIGTLCARMETWYCRSNSWRC